MKQSLAKSVAEFILQENQGLKSELISVKKTLKNIQDKMMQALDQLSLQYSTKIKGCQKLLLFDTPYHCLSAFVSQMAKVASHSIETAQQNKLLAERNFILQTRIKHIEHEIKQSKKRQEQIVQNLNVQIQTKKAQLNQLQQSYQKVLKAKTIAQRELGETKQHMKILRLKLYEQQRQKLTQIIVANKKQMIEFRRSMEMQAYKQEMQYKKQLQEKETQIRTLTKNIQELLNNSFTATSDLTVLQKIVQPIRDMKELKNQILALKKQSSDLKQQLRDKYATILSLQGKNADILMSRDNFKSLSQRLQIQITLLTCSLKETKQQLQKAVEDRKALDLYYGQKWHAEYSKVKFNLEEKFNKKTLQLQEQFEKKKKQISAQIQAYVEKVKVMKAQCLQVRKRNQELLAMNKRIQEDKRKITLLNLELRAIIQQSQNFHKEELQSKSFLYQKRINQLQLQLQNNQNHIRNLQHQYQQLSSKYSIQHNIFMKQKLAQIEIINQKHLTQINELINTHQRKIRALQNQYADFNTKIETIKSQQILKYQQKQKQLVIKNQQKIKQIHAQHQTKYKKLNEKYNQSEQRYQKLRKIKQQQLRQADNKLHQAKKVIDQRHLQLVTRDVQLQQYRKMKDTYMKQIQRLNKQINEEIFRKQTYKTELFSANQLIAQKQKTIKILQSKKLQFKQDLQELEKAYKKQFIQLKQTNKKIVAVHKKKIKQLQLLFEQRPIKQQHFQQIKSLEKRNSQLKTQMHLKQAENLILNQVKQYFQNKAFSVTKNKKQIQNYNSEQEQWRENHSLLKTANSFLRSQPNNQGMFIKKFKSRNNKLITNSYRRFDSFHDEEKEQSKQIATMRKYLLKQTGRPNVSSVQMRCRNNERVKSSMM